MFNNRFQNNTLENFNYRDDSPPARFCATLANLIRVYDVISYSLPLRPHVGHLPLPPAQLPHPHLARRQVLPAHGRRRAEGVQRRGASAGGEGEEEMGREEKRKKDAVYNV